MAKTNSGLVAYVKAKVGCYYWFGCFGQMSNTPGLYAAKKAQYPRYYKASDFDDQIKNPKQVFDCAGLIKAYLWTDSIDDTTPKYNSKQDYGATALYNNSVVKGKIASFDKVPGRLVYKGDNKTKSHVGVYIGEGDLIVEAKGHKYGVIISKLDSTWTHWSQSNLITDDTPKPEPAPTPAPTPAPEPQGYTGEFPKLPNRGYFKRGDHGSEVVKLQKLLMWISPGCLPRFGIDGDYGNETYNAVKVCQSILKVKVDGLYGRATQIAAKAYKK